jgi:hypothetical protein
MTTEQKWTDEQIVEWVTIIAICLFVYFPYEMIELSETSLGKLFFVTMVVYYSMVDPIYGIIACCVVIVYYQLELYHSVIAIHRDTLLSENMTSMQESLSIEVPKNEPDFKTLKMVVESYVPGESDIYSYTPGSSSKNYYETELLRGTNKKELLEHFRKSNCDVNGKLKYKGGTVRPEMSDHVFREIQFPNNSAKCNPCDPTCEFSIIEERINREEDLRPSSSKEAEIDWNQFFGHYLVTPISSIADDIFAFEHRISNFVLSSYSSDK